MNGIIVGTTILGNYYPLGGVRIYRGKRKKKPLTIIFNIFFLIKRTIRCLILTRLRAAPLGATSSGTQPWRFVFSVTNELDLGIYIGRTVKKKNNKISVNICRGQTFCSFCFFKGNFPINHITLQCTHTYLTHPIDACFRFNRIRLFY